MKREKNRKLHGSILLTVVFVMSVLIVFLFGTLTLALAANSRAHVNYSSAQTSITARGVAESAIKAIANNTADGKAYAKAIGKLSAGQEKKVPVQINGTGASSLGHPDEVVISYAGTKKYYDVEKGQWLERDLLKFTSNVTLGGVQQSSSVYVLKHYEEDNDGSGTGGAGFVTTAEAHIPCQSNLYGGSYINLPSLDDIKKYNYVYTDISTFKVDDEGPLPKQLIGPISTNNSFYLDNSGAFAEADLYVCNNMYINNWSGFVFPRAGTGITVWGDLYMTGNTGSHLSYSYYGVEDGLTFNKMPYIFVNGNISGGTIGLGEASASGVFPLNIFCGSINGTVASSDGIKIGGTVYCMDEDGENVLINTNDNPSVLYNWAGNVVNKVKDPVLTSKVNGGIYSNGTSLEIAGLTVNGNVCSRGDMIIGKGVTVNGDVICGGDLIIEGPGNTATTITGDVVCRGNLEIKSGNNNAKANIGGTVYNTPGEPVPVIYNNLRYTLSSFQPEYRDLGWTAGYVNPEKPWGLLNDGTVYINGQVNTELYSFEDAATVYMLPNDQYNPEQTPQSYMFDDNRLLTAKDLDEEIFDLDDLSFLVECEYSNGQVKAKQPVTPTTDEYFIYTPTPSEDDAAALDISEWSGDLSEIYPSYAKREVVIGLSTPTSNAEDTKIVKTIDEVLKNVADPYKANKLPPELLTRYNSYISKGSITDKGKSVLIQSEDDFEKVNVDANNKSYFVSSLDNKGNYTLTESGGGGNYVGHYVNTDLILDIGSIGADVVINPDGKNLLVVVRNTKGTGATDFAHVDTTGRAAFGRIYVDDRKGGSVYFYVDENKTLNFTNSTILTTSYADMLYSHSTEGIKYKSPTSPGYDISNLGTHMKPNVYIYGAVKSGLNITNATIMSVNIISPYLSGTISATDGKMGVAPASFYYDGIQVNKPKNASSAQTLTGQYLFGCFNAKNVTIDNMYNVIYATNDGDDSGGAHGGEDEFWYKPIYYSEF